MTREREAIAETEPSLGATLADEAPAERSSMPERGHAIGRFVVLDVLGTGGMGVVYAAYDPSLDRKVAIKVLRARSMESEEARLRLLREAQAMARIDHPNVLRVHEADAFGDHIYIAMEFAGGGTLRHWLAASRRSTREIVDLFVQAGRGLAAAHAAGLVHRDFKPDNVLLVGGGVARVTDFGLVGVVGELPRAASPVIDAPLSETTPLSQDLTRTGAMMGTPAYMSAEQFRGGIVGPAADQFAFCVALYEAVYGVRPFPGVTVAELCANVIAGELSPPPRDSDVPARIRRVLLRGLSREPGGRYSGMNQLLAELADHSRRRTRVAIGAATGALVAGGVAFALLGRGAGAECTGADARLAIAWSPAHQAKLAQAFDASHRPDARAVLEHLLPILDRWGQSWQQGYVGACEDTRVRRIQSERALDLRMACLSRALDDARPMLEALAAGGGDAVDHALDAARALPSVAPCADVAALTATVAPPPSVIGQQVVAGIRDKLAQAHALRKLGRYQAALAVARDALAGARATGYSPATAEALLEVGRLQSVLADRAAADTLGDAMHLASSVGDTETAVRAAAARINALVKPPARKPLADEIYELAAALATHARPSPAAMVALDNASGQLLAEEGHLDEAQARYQAALDLATAQLGADAPETISTLNGLGMLAARRHKFDDELRFFQQALASEQRISGPDHPSVAAAMENVANALDEVGKAGDSRAVREHALAIEITALGPDHPDVAASYGNIAGSYITAGDPKGAIPYFDKALAVLARLYGEDSVEASDVEGNMAEALNHMGDYDGARKLCEKALAEREKAYPADDPRIAQVLNQLGVVLRSQRRYGDALERLQRAHAIMEKVFGSSDPRVIDYLGNIAATYTDMGKLTDAREMTLQTIAAMSEAYGPGSNRVGAAYGNYGFLQIKLKDFAGAYTSFEKATAIFEATLGKNHPMVAFTLVGLAQALIRQHREAEAVPHLERALSLVANAHIAPNQLAELHFYLAIALIAKPANRERARSEAKLALAGYEQGHDAYNIAEAKQWLRKH